MVGIIAVGIAASIGMTLGLIAGYFGGITLHGYHEVHGRNYVFPDDIAGPGHRFFAWRRAEKRYDSPRYRPGDQMYARLMCGQVLSVRENDYVIAGRAIGASNLRIMLRHILPNCFPPLIV